MRDKFIFDQVFNIISRYLIKLIFISLIFIFILIELVIFGNQFVLIINDSLQYGINTKDLLLLLSFNMIRDTPLILSLSLFLAIIIVINRLYKNSEAVVMNSIGVGDKKTILMIQPLVITIAIISLVLTTIVIPWTKYEKSTILNKIENSSESLFIKPAEFKKFKNSNITLYAEEVVNDEKFKNQNLKDIFIKLNNDNELILISAQKAVKYVNPFDDIYMRFENGSRYVLPLDDANNSDESVEILNFDTYDLEVANKKLQESTSQYKWKSTIDLLMSDDLKEIAELQWRISQPLSIIILAILGVMLGKNYSRKSKNLSLIAGLILFGLYYNSLLISKSILEQEKISSIIGIWWTHLLMILLIFIIYFYKNKMFRFSFN